MDRPLFDIVFFLCFSTLAIIIYVITNDNLLSLFIFGVGWIPRVIFVIEYNPTTVSTESNA